MVLKIFNVKYAYKNVLKFFNVENAYKNGLKNLVFKINVLLQPSISRKKHILESVETDKKFKLSN